MPPFVLLLLALAPLAQAQTPPAQSALFRQAQIALLRGETAEAESKLLELISLNPSYPQAERLLERVKATRAPAAEAEARLRAFVVPLVDFKDATLGSVLEFLRQQAEARPEGSIPVNFVVRDSPAFPISQSKVTLRVENLPLTEIFRYLGNLTATTFTIEEHAVVVVPDGVGANGAAPVPETKAIAKPVP